MCAMTARTLPTFNGRPLWHTQNRFLFVLVSFALATATQAAMLNGTTISHLNFDIVSSFQKVSYVSPFKCTTDSVYVAILAHRNPSIGLYVPSLRPSNVPLSFLITRASRMEPSAFMPNESSSSIQ